MKYITNKYHSINLPYSEEMLEWLCENYPHSQYHAVDINPKK